MLKLIITTITTVALLFCNLFGLTGYKATENENYKTYKNVIIMIGDGMGFNTIAATEKMQNMTVSMKSMPVLCQSQTRSASSKVTDSAAGGTALACGVRTYNSGVAVYPFAPLGNSYNVPLSLTELAKANGKAAGVVTTDKTSGATPAAFSAHTVTRTFELDISVDQMTSGLDLIWGAASESVTKDRCERNGFTYIDNADDMNSLTAGTRSFAQFDFDAFANVSNENGTPEIADMTSKAIELLNADDDGFFLMVEGAHIDKFSHKNNFDGATAQLAQFSKAVQTALDFAAKDGNTLVLVTADHETGGITYNEAEDEYYYTTGSHTGVNVPVFVSAIDAGFVSGEEYKNCEISTQLARVMGYDKAQFPAMRG